MLYFYLEPEVAGGLGEHTVMDTSVHPPVVSKLHYEFEGWLGDDLLESFPCYIVTARLKEGLEQAQATGCTFGDVEVSRSDSFKGIYPDRKLPEFYWLRTQPQAGAADFGLADDHRLVASERILGLMRANYRLAQCDVEPYP
jgi:hypothetical protein